MSGWPRVFACWSAIQSFPKYSFRRDSVLLSKKIIILFIYLCFALRSVQKDYEITEGCQVASCKHLLTDPWISSSSWRIYCLPLPSGYLPGLSSRLWILWRRVFFFFFFKLSYLAQHQSQSRSCISIWRRNETGKKAGKEHRTAKHKLIFLAKKIRGMKHQACLYNSLFLSNDHNHYDR